MDFSKISGRVLLVNDSRDEREMYAMWLRRSGCCTLQADNARDALRLARELHPQVVITDRMLSGGEDGLALARHMKAEPDTRNSAIVMLSAYVYETDDAAARNAGCDVVVHKPCLPDALAQIVRTLLEQPHGRSAGAASNQFARRSA